MSMTSTFLDHSQSRSHFPLTLFSHCPTFIRSFKQIKITNNTHTHTNDAICGQKAVDIHIFAIPSIRWPFVRILSSNFLTPNIFIFLLFSLTHFWPVFFFFAPHILLATQFQCHFRCLSFRQRSLCAFLSFTTVPRSILRISFAYFFFHPTRIQYVVHDFHRSHAQANFHTQSYIIFGSCVVYAFFVSLSFSILLRYIHLILSTRALRNALIMCSEQRIKLG